MIILNQLISNESSLSKVVRKINYTDKLISYVSRYNENLEMISKMILNLKITFNESDIRMKNLHEIFDELSVIYDDKTRKITEELLKDIIIEYGYQLETKIRE